MSRIAQKFEKTFEEALYNNHIIVVHFSMGEASYLHMDYNSDEMEMDLNINLDCIELTISGDGFEFGLKFSPDDIEYDKLSGEYKANLLGFEDGEIYIGFLNR